jgi:acyl transferase domain-containing protein
LSGRLPEIDRATELFASRNIRGKKLAVAAAFHSPLVATASRAFRPVLDEVEFAPSRMPVYADSTATEYPADPVAARDLLATQLARPVNFVSEVERMYADGVRTFLEVGPSGVLTGLVNSILNGREYRAIAVDSSGGKRGGVADLANAFAQLSAAGHPVRLGALRPERAKEQMLTRFIDTAKLQAMLAALASLVSCQHHDDTSASSDGAGDEPLGEMISCAVNNSSVFNDDCRLERDSGGLLVIHKPDGAFIRLRMKPGGAVDTAWVAGGEARRSNLRVGARAQG